MRWLTIAITLIFLACGRSESDPGQTPVDLQQKMQQYEQGSLDLIPRCDGATFKTHAASVEIVQDLSGLEKTPGRLERDVQPCYPGDSSAETSREVYIGWLHEIWTNKDLAALDRVMSYGKDHAWTMGVGPADLVNIAPLVPIMELMHRSMGLTATTMPLDIQGSLTGFRGHVLASYLWLWARVTKHMGPIGLEAIDQLTKASPNDPMYKALKSRFFPSGQNDVLEQLRNDPIFPNGKVPDTVGSFGWGSAPDFLYFLMTLKIAQGE